MWKLLVVLTLLAQRNISSEPVQDAVRETRQLNFDDCCPCPTVKQDALLDQDEENTRTIATSTDDTCPCRLISDSEAASSIFSPAFRAVERFNRPVPNKDEPKPLLMPEVGLASSVLETLQEVTDQEYQEALARDAARNSLKFMESELPEIKSRNLINIILSPKKENSDEIISEASHVQESHCQIPASNTFKQLRLQPPMKFLENIFTSPKLGNNNLLRKNLFDMDESPSNIKEKILQPIKNNILDDIQAKANLLKLRLFPNTENKLRNSVNNDFGNAVPIDLNTDERFPKLLNEHITRVPEYKSPSILDYIKSPQHNIWATVPVTNTEEKSKAINKDILVSPSILKKYYIKNNMKDRIFDQESLYNTVEKLNLQSPNKLQGFVGETAKNVDMELDGLANIKQNLFGSAVRDLKMPDSDNLIENTDCSENGMKPIKSLPLTENIDELDVVPSSSKKIEVKNQDQVIQNTNQVGLNRQSEKYSDEIHMMNVNPDTFNDINSLSSQSVIEKDFSSNQGKVTTEGVTEDIIIVNEQNSDFGNENTTKNSTNMDLKFESSLTSSKISTLQDPDTDICTYFVDTNNTDNINYIDSKNQTPAELLSSTSIETDVVEQDVVTMKTHTLPYIKADILRTLENFKKANEKIQNKLRSNVQNALQLVVMKTDSQKGPSTSFVDSQQTFRSNVTNTTNENNINTQDLQKMSDSLLELSSLQEKMETTTISGIKAELVEETNKLNNSISTDNKSNSNPYYINDIDKMSDVQKEFRANYIMVNSSVSPAADNKIDEMTAQSSNSILNTVPQLGSHKDKLSLLPGDFIVQPEDIKKLSFDDLKDFLNNFKPVYKDSDSLTIEPSYRSYKNFERDDSLNIISDSSLNKYKAKVKTPESLNINTLVPSPTSTDRDFDVLGFATQRKPASILRYSSEPNNFGTLIRNDGQNGLNSQLNEQIPKIFRNMFSSTPISIFDRYEPQKNNVLKSFRDSLDNSLRKPLDLNSKNILNKSFLTPENLWETVLKTRENLNNKLGAINSDLSRKRLGLISPRISSDDSPPVLTRNSGAELSNKKNKMNGKTPLQIKSPVFKNNLFSNNRSTKLKSESILLPSNKFADISSQLNKPSVFRSNTKQKLNNSPHQIKSNFEKETIEINPLKTRRPLPKTFLKNNIKIKPLRENKVTISFTTTSTRPDILKSELRPSLIDHLKSRSVGGFTKYSNLSRSSSKKPSSKSILKLDEPKVLASNKIISRTPFPTEQSKIVQDRSSIEDLEQPHEVNSNSLDSTANPSQGNKEKTSLIYKIKNRAAARGSTGIKKTNNNNKNLDLKRTNEKDDAIQSASNNIDSSADGTVLEPLKENTSYKCKMVCIKDILEATDKLSLRFK